MERRKSKRSEIQKKMSAYASDLLQLHDWAKIDHISLHSSKYAIRDAYFAVERIDLRKRLIETRTHYDKLKRENDQEWLSEQIFKSIKAKGRAGLWWLWAALWGCAYVAIGANSFGTSGAIGGAVVAYFFGRYWEGSAAARIVEADAQAADARAVHTSQIDDTMTFTLREQETGEEDK